MLTRTAGDTRRWRAKAGDLRGCSVHSCNACSTGNIWELRDPGQSCAFPEAWHRKAHESHNAHEEASCLFASLMLLCQSPLFKQAQAEQLALRQVIVYIDIYICTYIHVLCVKDIHIYIYICNIVS